MKTFHRALQTVRSLQDEFFRGLAMDSRQADTLAQITAHTV
jgi:hypothetical protein